MINQTSKDIYIYCIDFTLDLILFNISLFLLGFLLHEPFMALLYIITITPLKMICGGAHATTPTLCSIISYFVFIFSILCSVYIIPFSCFHISENVITILCIVSIVSFTPVDAQSKKYLSSQKHKLKTISIVYCTILFTASIIFKTYLHEKYCTLIAICFIIIAVNQYIGIIINRKGSLL